LQKDSEKLSERLNEAEKEIDELNLTKGSILKQAETQRN
jgi:hypothetical protein